MPSGRTHDRITLWSLPLVAGLTFGLTLSGNLTLLVLSGFLFSGLMFGPDLDIHSRQYVRWGWLRWIWIPYQRGLRHRSIFSHGPILGTTLRLLYIACWLGVVGLLVLGVAQVLWGVGWKWQIVAVAIQESLFGHSHEWLALFLGLELGAMSHALSDWSGSTYKRFKKGGLKAVMLGGAKRRKSSRGRLQGRHRRDACATNTQATKTQGTKTQATKTQATKTQATKTQATKTQGTKTQATKTQATQTQGTKTQATQTQGTKTQATQTQGTKTQGTKTQGTQTQGTKTQGTQTQGTQTQGTKTQGTKTQGTKTQGTETQATQTQGTQTQGTKTQGTKTQGRRQPRKKQR